MEISEEIKVLMKFEYIDKKGDRNTINEIQLFTIIWI